MKHYSGGSVIEAQERDRMEAIDAARDLYDELAEINKAIQLSQWHDIGNGERAKRIMIAEEAVKRIEKRLSEGFSWRTKL